MYLKLIITLSAYSLHDMYRIRTSALLQLWGCNCRNNLRLFWILAIASFHMHCIVYSPSSWLLRISTRPTPTLLPATLALPSSRLVPGTSLFLSEPMLSKSMGPITPPSCGRMWVELKHWTWKVLLWLCCIYSIVFTRGTTRHTHTGSGIDAIVNEGGNSISGSFVWREQPPWTKTIAHDTHHDQYSTTFLSPRKLRSKWSLSLHATLF